MQKEISVNNPLFRLFSVFLLRFCVNSASKSSSVKHFNIHTKMSVAENKSEEKHIKMTEFCRKVDFPLLFREKTANFVHVFYMQ